MERNEVMVISKIKKRKKVLHVTTGKLRKRERGEKNQFKRRHKLRTFLSEQATTERKKDPFSQKQRKRNNI